MMTEHSSETVGAPRKRSLLLIAVTATVGMACSAGTPRGASPAHARGGHMTQGGSSTLARTENTPRGRATLARGEHKPRWIAALHAQFRRADTDYRKVVSVQAAARFRWTRLFVFISGPRSDIQSRLGFRWRGAPADVPNSASLLVLVKKRAVVSAALFPSKWGDFGCEAEPKGFARAHTRFYLHPSSRTYSDPPLLLAVANDPPVAHERQCLRVVGAR